MQILQFFCPCVFKKVMRNDVLDSRDLDKDLNNILSTTENQNEEGVTDERWVVEEDKDRRRNKYCLGECRKSRKREGGAVVTQNWTLRMRGSKVKTEGTTLIAWRKLRS